MGCNLEKKLIEELQTIQSPFVKFEFDLEKGISSYTIWEKKQLYVFGLKNGKVTPQL